MGGRIEPLAGDIGVGQRPAAQAWVRTDRALARAAVMRRNLLSAVPWPAQRAGTATRAANALAKGREHTPWALWSHLPGRAFFFLPLAFVFCLQPYEDKEPLSALTNTGLPCLAPRARTCQKGHGACSWGACAGPGVLASGHPGSGQGQSSEPSPSPRTKHPTCWWVVLSPPALFWGCPV